MYSLLEEQKIHEDYGNQKCYGIAAVDGENSYVFSDISCERKYVETLIDLLESGRVLPRFADWIIEEYISEHI